jgi:hypothetical protein
VLLLNRNVVIPNGAPYLRVNTPDPADYPEDRRVSNVRGKGLSKATLEMRTAQFGGSRPLEGTRNLFQDGLLKT